MTLSAPCILPAARLSREQAHALRTLVQNVQDLPVPWGEQTWHLSLQPQLEQGTLPLAPGEWRIGLSWSGLPFELLMPDTGVHAWMRTRFPDLDLPALPEPFLAAALETACDTLANLLPGAMRDSVRIERWSSTPLVDHGLPHAFWIALRSGETVLRGQLATSMQGLLHLARLAQELTPSRNGMDLSGLPIPLKVAIGMTCLSLDDLAHLKPRDTILFDLRLLDEDGQLWLRQGDMALRARRQGQELIVTEPMTQRGGAVPPENEYDAALAELSALDHLPLRVVFDLGELSMTLAEIQSLQVGQPLALACPLSSAVNLRVNGALIGTGELVEIEGELGVTITTLFQRPAAKSARTPRTGTRSRARGTSVSPQEVPS